MIKPCNGIKETKRLGSHTPLEIRFAVWCSAASNIGRSYSTGENLLRLVIGGWKFLHGWVKKRHQRVLKDSYVFTWEVIACATADKHIHRTQTDKKTDISISSVLSLNVSDFWVHYWCNFGLKLSTVIVALRCDWSDVRI